MAEIIRSTSNSEYKRMGKNGYRNIIDTYSKEIVTAKYVSLINNILS